MLKPYKISQLLFASVEQVELIPKEKYKQIKLRLNNNGCVLRNVVNGEEVFSRQYLAKKEQFIISKIDARNGAMALVPPELDSAVVTGDFLLFDINEEIVTKQYFDFYTRQRQFIALCKSCSEGSTNRVRLKVDKLLGKEILLPNIEHQKNSVNTLLEVDKRIKQISALRSQQAKEVRQLIFSRFFQITYDCPRLPFSEVAPINRRPVEIEPETIYHEVGARSFGKGLFDKPSFQGKNLTWQQPYWIHSGDLVFSNIKAWEGAVAAAGDLAHLKVASHRYLTYTPNNYVTSAEFLCYYFLTPEGLEILGKASPGSADRNRTLNTRFLNNITIPIPSPEIQLEFLEFKNKMETVQKHHSNTLKELDELFPSLLNKAFKGEL
ncbi:MAG TPA: restriction endonuclease subunit S [Segetibacter sp.]|jgi:type I restriction enzyme S subunit